MEDEDEYRDVGRQGCTVVLRSNSRWWWSRGRMWENGAEIRPQLALPCCPTWSGLAWPGLAVNRVTTSSYHSTTLGSMVPELRIRGRIAAAVRGQREGRTRRTAIFPLFGHALMPCMRAEHITAVLIRKSPSSSRS